MDRVKGPYTFSLNDFIYYNDSFVTWNGLHAALLFIHIYKGGAQTYSEVWWQNLSPSLQHIHFHFVQITLNLTQASCNCNIYFSTLAWIAKCLRNLGMQVGAFGGFLSLNFSPLSFEIWHKSSRQKVCYSAKQLTECLWWCMLQALDVCICARLYSKSHSTPRFTDIIFQLLTFQSRRVQFLETYKRTKSWFDDLVISPSKMDLF